MKSTGTRGTGLRRSGYRDNTEAGMNDAATGANRAIFHTDSAGSEPESMTTPVAVPWSPAQTAATAIPGVLAQSRT
jgi:hypothetical protein